MVDPTRRNILAAGALSAFAFTYRADAVFSRFIERPGQPQPPLPQVDPDAEKFSELGTGKGEVLRLVRDLIADRGEVIKVVGGKAHYRYPNRLHPDDEWARDTIVACTRGLYRKHEIESPGGDFDAIGSFACTGSPVSNDRTRKFLEYAYIDSTRPDRGLRRAPNARLKLPFEFVLDSSALARKGQKQRTIETGHSGPNYLIRDRSDSELYIPSTGKSETDFLLISRVPNWVEERQKLHDFKSGVTMFCGCHGVGTSAVGLLFENLDLLKQIQQISKSYEYWQAIVLVKTVRRCMHPKTGTVRPVAIALADKLVNYGRVEVS